MNVMVIAPHADDEILGCGGTISKYIDAGYNVHILIVTKGLKPVNGKFQVREEAKKLHKFLKTKLIFLDFKTTCLDVTRTAEIAEQIFEEISKNNIQILFIPHRGDIHNDHREVFDAALVASRPVNNNPVKEIYAYETLSETEWSPPYSSNVFIPNVFIDIEDYIDLKINAMEYYKSQIKTFPNPRSKKGIIALAQYRGATIGVKYAEAFMLIRKIKNTV